VIPPPLKTAIIPTGDEVARGIVADTNSPAIAALIREAFPDCATLCCPAVVDSESAIRDEAEKMIREGADLLIFIGGSGGGRRFDPRLARDCTHEALRTLADRSAVRDIYGSNGHLWARLVAGEKDGSLLFNVPGPYVEAVAAARAALGALATEAAPDLEELAETLARAVWEQYPPNAARRPSP
jgi:molybdopterin biosynthesis enzyme